MSVDYAARIGEITLQDLALTYPDVQLSVLRDLMDEFYEFEVLEDEAKELKKIAEEEAELEGLTEEERAARLEKSWWQFWK